MTISFHKTYHVTRACSLDQHDERLRFFDEMRGEPRHVGGAYVLHHADRFGRDEKTLSALTVVGGLPSTSYPSDPFEDVDDPFARMLVLEGWRFRADVHAVLDDFASGYTEIVLLEIGALDPRRLLLGAAHVTLRALVVAGHRSRAARTVCARRPRPPVNAVT
jgi:hypothetical protein